MILTQPAYTYTPRPNLRPSIMSNQLQQGSSQAPSDNTAQGNVSNSQLPRFAPQAPAMPAMTAPFPFSFPPAAFTGMFPLPTFGNNPQAAMAAAGYVAMAAAAAHHASLTQAHQQFQQHQPQPHNPLLSLVTPHPPHTFSVPTSAVSTAPTSGQTTPQPLTQPYSSTPTSALPATPDKPPASIHSVSLTQQKSLADASTASTPSASTPSTSTSVLQLEALKKPKRGINSAAQMAAAASAAAAQAAGMTDSTLSGLHQIGKKTLYYLLFTSSLHLIFFLLLYF